MLSRIISTYARTQLAQRSFQSSAPAFSFSRFTDKLTNIKSQQQSLYTEPIQPTNVYVDPKGQQMYIDPQTQGVYQQPQPQVQTTMQHIVSNAGLNSFVSRVYKTTGLSILGALATSQAAVLTGFANYHPVFCGLGGFAMTMVGIIASSKILPMQYSKVIDGQTYNISKNTPTRLALYAMSMAGLGLSSSLLFSSISMMNPAILPISIGITSLVFGSASLYALYKPKDSLIGLGSSLYAGLFGLIGLQLAGMLTQVFIGPNLFTYMCHRADTFIGLGLFTAMVAYDTHVAVKAYEVGNADHLGVSIAFTLDFWNILVRVTQILGLSSRD